MTYCVAVLVRQGVLLAADTRTSAGVDHIATFRKLVTFEQNGQRFIALASAGNLATTQAAITLLRESVARRGARGNPMKAPSMFHVARIVGATLREIAAIDGDHVRAHNGDPAASFLLGGQIKGEPPRLFHIYDAGNFIEATADTPFLQIGETKYGKPILDRIIHPEMPLNQAAKCALLSFDSTMRSNMSVGLPINLWCYATDSFAPGIALEIGERNSYFEYLRRGYGDGIAKVVESLPDPPGL